MFLELVLSFVPVARNEVQSDGCKKNLYIHVTLAPNMALDTEGSMKVLEPSYLSSIYA